MSKNTGHRLFGDVSNKKPNTVASMMVGWAHQKEKDFKYWETDINECINDLVIIHDRNLKSGEKVRVLTLGEIKRKEPYRVSLKELFQEFQNLDRAMYQGLHLCRPILVEIKRIYTDKRRQQLIDEIVAFRKLIGNRVPVHCISFDSFTIKHFKKSFPRRNRKAWGEKFGLHGINVLKIGNHKKDLFGNPLYEITPHGKYIKTYKKKSLWRKFIDWLRGR